MFIDKKIYEIYPINPTYPDMLKKYHLHLKRFMQLEILVY